MNTWCWWCCPPHTHIHAYKQIYSIIIHTGQDREGSTDDSRTNMAATLSPHTHTKTIVISICNRHLPIYKKIHKKGDRIPRMIANEAKNLRPLPLLATSLLFAASSRLLGPTPIRTKWFATRQSSLEKYQSRGALVVKCDYRKWLHIHIRKGFVVFIL